ncbi:SDR family oxidoreductase [Paenibacillus sp. KS-LC4]|uniref:SDR family NAD(P)-dependent oxidoreductase n=1 Tax=Paenibacillus sp. KS-LC4 TaxID=2979727 RepID=UPI0030D488C3
MEAVKRAVVTGGTRGIGKVITERLIAAGYFVDFTFVQSYEHAEELERRYAGKCRGAKVDSRHPEEVRKYIENISSAEPITVLVNNAGITFNALAKEGTWEDFQDTLNINLGGSFHFCKELIPQMNRARNGDIIMISSLASDNVRVGNAYYGTSKAAVNRFTETLAIELARMNIACNIISPGFVETDLVKELLTDEKRRELLKEIPLRRFTLPEEVADAVMFLLGRKPLLIGANIPLGGGGHLR